ncbi:MAG: BRO family protein [Alphaproteobacteria bacterium]|nr:BRO family protein [Alphaproteobacteria bacterium]
MNKITTIHFNNQYLDVYGDIEEPSFLAVEVARIVDYSNGNTQEMLNLVEDDEKFWSTVKPLTKKGGNRKPVWFLTELGLYNILSQSRKPIARMWRRVVHQQLIDSRKVKGMDVEEQFAEWDDLADTVYIDPETGILMQSITIAGGDVEQIPCV